MSTASHEQSAFQSGPVYAPPLLVAYGSVADLTAGGSNGDSEVNNGGNCPPGQTTKRC